MRKPVNRNSHRFSGIDSFKIPSKKSQLLTLCLFILILYSCRSRTEKNNISTAGKEVVLKLDPGPDNPRNSEGDFITLKNGSIMYIYTHYTGNKGDDNDNAYLAASYSDDEGRTWNKEDVKIVGQEGKLNVISVSLLRLRSGEIALFYLKIKSESDCIPMLRISNDEAKSWSDPIACISDKPGYFVLNNNRVIQLENGRILFAVALHQSFKERRGSIWSYYSDDSGRTWIPGNEASNPDSIITQEPGVVELKNGDIMMFMRTTDGVQYLSFSKDKGISWSSVERSIIKSPCSPASITRIPSSGDLLMVWNNNGENQKRTPLNIAISKDEGKSWEKIKILENNPDGTFCYTAIHFAGRDVLLGYSDWSTMGSTILRLGTDWIYN
jgi:sialidase-1